MDYQTLEALQADLRECRRCAEAGYDIQSRSVFSGADSARVMIVGQAPGVSEVDVRLPFYGDAGRRLFRWLDRAGWDEKTFRARHYITSVTKCFPGTNPNGTGDRVPSAGERKLCRPWLEGEIRLVNPALIVPVGTLAIGVFFEKGTRLSDVIGERRTDGEGRIIVPLPHPSGASRWFNDPKNVGLLEQAIWHLRTLRAELDL